MLTNTSGSQDGDILDAEDFGKKVEAAGLGEKVTETVSALIAIIGELDSKIDEVVEEKSTLNDEISDLKKERDTLQQKVSDLQTELETAEQTIRDLS